MEKTAGTALNLGGRVRYMTAEYSGIGAEDMRRAGEKLAEAFLAYEVEVTAGPYRFHDVAYRLNREEKRIILDFYSVRPGLDRIDEVIREIMGKLLLDDNADTWTP